MLDSSRPLDAPSPWLAGPLSASSSGSLLSSLTVSAASAARSSFEFGAGLLYLWGKLSLILLAAVAAVQATSIGFQAYEDHQLAQPLSVFRQEQRWMASEGLAPADRPLGARAHGWLRHTGDVSGSGTSMNYSTTLFGRWDAALPTLVLDSLLTRKGAPSFITRGHSISVGLDDLSSSSMAGLEPFAFRHEEAHAQTMEAGLLPEAPSEWPPEITQALRPRFLALRDSESASRNWRESWMSTFWLEAYADAFSLISGARKGARASALEIAQVYLARSNPSSLSDGAISALDMAGSDHAVDMAALLVSRIPHPLLASLSLSEAQQLSAQIADRSLAWGLARQAPSIDFFSPLSKLIWFDPLLSQLSEARRSDLWQRWQQECLSAKPRAVFSPIEFHLRGQTLRVAGLSASEAAHWRFDGFGGRVRKTMSPLEDSLRSGEASGSSASGPASDQPVSFNRPVVIAVTPARERLAFFQASVSHFSELLRSPSLTPADRSALRQSLSSRRALIQPASSKSSAKPPFAP